MTFFNIQGLHKQFGGLVAVKDLSMMVHKGEIVCLIGPNGAGKTTLFNLITGFYTPQRGQILLREKNLIGMGPNKICKMGIARTFQIVMPFQTLTVLDNTKVGAFCRTTSNEEAIQTSIDILNFLGLGDKIHFPASTLTLSQKKKLELARALATRPHVLLLDETLAGLNATETESMIETIRWIRAEKGITILAVEHVMRAVMKISDRIVVMDLGRKIAEGPPREVVQNPEVIKAYLGEEYGHP